MYRRSALISSVITRACERVSGFYGLSRTPDKIREDVEWLLTDSKFMYGDINVKVWTLFHLANLLNKCSLEAYLWPSETVWHQSNCWNHRESIVLHIIKIKYWCYHNCEDGGREGHSSGYYYTYSYHGMFCFFFISLSWLSTFRLSIHWKSGEMAGK